MPTRNEKPPLTRLGRRPAFTNKVWCGYFDHIVGNNGTEVEDYLVLVPRGDHPDMLCGVSVLPVLDGRVALMRVFRLGSDRWGWETPRGFVDAGEPPETAAHRELAEETGLACPAGSLVSLGFYTPENSTIQARGALFAAEGCVRVQDRDMAEIGLGALRLFTLEEALALADSSEIEDSSTALMLYRYARRKSYT
ncbi:NUDIX hydrolase [Azospirillum sp. B510]|uniref:NUDIX hydrolase n=1 Tax=Azospirillum sp. (strain B510) TaxID=137722 RepID=UPI0005A9E9C0|nr:NUDIX hydrolase [Azospirillum sp. B510]